MARRYALEGLVPSARAGVERLRNDHLHPLLTQAGFQKSRERRKRILRWHRWIGDAFQGVEVCTSTRADLFTRLTISFEFGFREAAALLAAIPGPGLAFASEDRPVCDHAVLAMLSPQAPYPAVWTLTGASADERALEIVEAVKTVGLPFLDRVSTPDGALAWWSEQIVAQCWAPRTKRVRQAALLWSLGRDAEARAVLPDDLAEPVLERFAAHAART